MGGKQKQRKALDVWLRPRVTLAPPTQPVKVSQGSTYSELLSVIEEMSREIRPTYAGSKSAMERLKRGTANSTRLLLKLQCTVLCCWV